MSQLPLYPCLCRRSAEHSIYLEGHHEVDLDWLDSVRSALPASSSHRLSVVPRVIFETEISTSQEISTVASLLAEAKRRYNFDGFTIESTLSSMKQLEVINKFAKSASHFLNL